VTYQFPHQATPFSRNFQTYLGLIDIDDAVDDEVNADVIEVTNEVNIESGISAMPDLTNNNHFADDSAQTYQILRPATARLLPAS